MSKSAILIDDDQADLDSLKETIKRIDPQLLCISFIYPDEALRVVLNELIFVPNYIFIDINMHGITGDKLLRELRKKRELQETIITMFSSSVPPAVAQALKEAGANHSFEKPSSLTQYKTILEKILLP